MRRLDEIPIVESVDTISIQSRVDNVQNSNQVNYFDRDSALNASKGLRRIVISTLIFSLIITFALIIQIWFGPDQVPSRIGIITPEQQCSEIGAQMIRQNGNSADAFISSALCLSVVNPFSAGFGAGGFLVVRDHKHNKNMAINCWFKSGSIDININLPESTTFVAIPGELKCLQYIYHKYSRLWWSTLVTPAANLARNGFKVSKQLANNLRKENLNNELLKRFLNKDGKLAEENDILTNSELATTLENIDKDENNLYHGGKLTKDLTKNAQTLTVDDLKHYSVVDSTIITKYQDFMLLTTQYPSNGPILKFLFDLMSKLDVKLDDFVRLEFYHRFIEAAKLGYIAQSSIGDSKQFMELLTNRLEDLTENFSQLTDQNKTIDLDSFFLKQYEQNDNLYVNYISVNDHNDLMVSYVGSLGSLWGSQVVTDAGFVLNDGLKLFSFNKSDNFSQANLYDKHKQPRGLLAPIITYHSKNPCIRRLVVAYGHKDQNDYGISVQTQVLLKIFTDLKYYPESVEDKRVQYTQSGICFERGFSELMKQEILKNPNHFESQNSNKTCLFDALSIIMKKDPIISLAMDNQRASTNANGIIFNS